ncbi:4a-hydroxytetrahydrobiopterin dehydratase [Candidatus Parcubacteria bacterium]|nr:MAG: 4a-hydroxytetrahydrobiopterin dehydratase [Candidatus Parcubacteria bacterium]
MTELAQKKCVACEGFETPFVREEAIVLLKQVKNWQLADDAKSISKAFTFKNFADALEFTNKVGAIAEEEGHHPDIELAWGKVKVFLTTHAIHGLSENDFILAAKIDQLNAT